MARRLTGIRRAISAVISAVIVYIIVRFMFSRTVDWETFKLVIAGTAVSAIVTRWMHTKGEKRLRKLGI